MQSPADPNTDPECTLPTRIPQRCSIPWIPSGSGSPPSGSVDLADARSARGWLRLRERIVSGCSGRNMKIPHSATGCSTHHSHGSVSPRDWLYCNSTWGSFLPPPRRPPAPASACHCRHSAASARQCLPVRYCQCLPVPANAASAASAAPNTRCLAPRQSAI